VDGQKERKVYYQFTHIELFSTHSFYILMRRDGFWEPDGFEEHGGPVMDDGQQARPQPTGAYWPNHARNPRLAVHPIGLPPPQVNYCAYQVCNKC